jgi:transcriptional regulator with XRE-family HTH domain
MENLSIGTRIKQRRKELGLTQVQIKQITGISSGNMSEIENGNKLPSTPTLISLSAILDCSIDWMLKGETSKRENIFLSDKRSEQLLKGFQELPEDDKEELIEILEIKLRKVKKEKDMTTKSSGLTGTEKSNILG